MSQCMIPIICAISLSTPLRPVRKFRTFKLHLFSSQGARLPSFYKVKEDGRQPATGGKRFLARQHDSKRRDSVCDVQAESAFLEGDQAESGASYTKSMEQRSSRRSVN